ncbi:HMA domain-containing protein [Cephalotus follicularis]|uniref:HMA domain-containing protein n=1 Tax=Cephalotus follicularis TaxID=3775 RepID=A0A1Q3AWC5_CEPFO|nr:HMA domain-containing protein [Cephalotus follicularis]
MAEKETIMVIKVDLQCDRCYRKIKKVLCRYPQIRTQIYDEKNNTVTITVVCCSPEKIKQKICRRGGDTVKGIEIKEPPKPQPPPEKKPEAPKEAPKPQPDKPKEAPKPPAAEKPKETPKPQPAAEKPKEATKPQPAAEKPKEAPKPQPAAEKPKEAPKPQPAAEKPKEAPKPQPAEKPKEAPKPPAPQPPEPQPVPVAYPPAPPANPIGLCCAQCYEGRYWGPCFHGYGVPPPYYGEYYGRPVYESWGGGGNRAYYPCNYICEENPSACTIM